MSRCVRGEEEGDAPSRALAALSSPSLGGGEAEVAAKAVERRKCAKGTRLPASHVTAPGRAKQVGGLQRRQAQPGDCERCRRPGSPGSCARGPGPAALLASHCTFSPGGGATCSSVHRNMATQSSRRESRLSFLFTLVALLPPVAVCEVWTQTLHGGRSPLPQDRGFLVVQGDARELRLLARGDTRGADGKQLRRRRSAALQPEPIKVYGQVSSLQPTFQSFPLPALPHPRIHPLQSPPGAGTTGDFPACICPPTPPHEYNSQHLNFIVFALFPVDFSNVF